MLLLVLFLSVMATVIPRLALAKSTAAAREPGAALRHMRFHASAAAGQCAFDLQGKWGVLYHQCGFTVQFHLPDRQCTQHFTVRMPRMG